MTVAIRGAILKKETKASWKMKGLKILIQEESMSLLMIRTRGVSQIDLASQNWIT
jgi:hypothetical protein